MQTSNHYSSSMHNSPGHPSYNPATVALYSFLSSQSLTCLNYDLLIFATSKACTRQSLLGVFNLHHELNITVFITCNYTIWVGLRLGVIISFYFSLPPLKSFPGHLPQWPIIIKKSPKQVWKALEIFWLKTTREWSMAEDDELCLWKGLGMKNNPETNIQKYLNVQSWGEMIFQFFIFPLVQD